MKKIIVMLGVGVIFVAAGGCGGSKAVTQDSHIIKSDLPTAAEQVVPPGAQRASAEALETGKRKWRVGDTKNAVKQFRKAVQKNPYNFEAHYWLAVVDRDNARWEQANQHFQEAVKYCPAGRWESRIRVDWGLMFETEGQKGLAAKQYDLALLADPEFRDAQTARQRVLPPPSASYDK